MGMADCKNRLAIAGSTASKAAIPRCEMAKLMDRCCEAVLNDGRRISNMKMKRHQAKHSNSSKKKYDINRKTLTWPTFVKIDTPATLSQRHGR
jgi:hypothetical protein